MANVSQQNVLGPDLTPGESCGACAASYALEELCKANYSAANIIALWNKVTFVANAAFDGAKHPNPLAGGAGVCKSHTDPTKLAPQLTGKGLKVHAFLNPKSPLGALVKLGILHDKSMIDMTMSIEDLKKNATWRAIGIYHVGKLTALLPPFSLHYVLTKYEGGKYHLKDSNGKPPAYAQSTAAALGAGAPAKANVNNVGMQDYTFLGAGLLVHV